MDDKAKISLVSALAAGYFLGRTRKAKFALAVASLVGGAAVPSNPRELLSLALRELAKNPQFEPLIEQVRGELLTSGRAALSSTADRRLLSLADALKERTAALQEPAEGPEDEEAEDEETDGEYEDEDAYEEEEPAEEAEEEEEDEYGEEEAEEEEPAPRPRAKKAPPKKAPPRKTAAKKAPAKKSAAKKAPAKKTAAKKTAAKKSAAKKSTSTRRR
ncbi:hypothetical protein ABZ929_20645 [Streptomyces physcomitrii]|uniref:hypothetical protein n=1 Tax=Streptomyces physcomitrii TaxID=2724184 RepID=UPI003441926E